MKGALEQITDCCFVDTVPPTWEGLASEHLDTRRHVLGVAFRDLSPDDVDVFNRCVEHDREFGTGARKAKSTMCRDKLECQMTLAGFISFSEDLRPEACETVAELEQADIESILITGDHPVTAMRVAQDVGILVHPSDFADPESWDCRSQSSGSTTFSNYLKYSRKHPHVPSQRFFRPLALRDDYFSRLKFQHPATYDPRWPQLEADGTPEMPDRQPRRPGVPSWSSGYSRDSFSSMGSIDRHSSVFSDTEDKPVPRLPVIMKLETEHYLGRKTEKVVCINMQTEQKIDVEEKFEKYFGYLR